MTKHILDLTSNEDWLKHKIFNYTQIFKENKRKEISHTKEDCMIKECQELEDFSKRHDIMSIKNKRSNW